MNIVVAKLLIFLIIFSLGLGVGSKYISKNTPANYLVLEKNTPQAFIKEVYDKIKENYWDNISDAQLIEMFKNAQSALGNPIASKITNKDELIKNLDLTQAVKIVSQVLASLPPAGRSLLYTQKQEEQLKNTVNNVNPQTGKVEPTIFSKTIGPILYVQFKKFSPTSYDEFVKTFNSYQENSSLTGLIFDLRGNIGGAIDATPYFLGNFLGKGAYAFDFYHKGEYLPFKTPTEKLPSISKYKQVVILVDQNTQSSAEIMAASLKKFHTGVVVGITTKGWGTVERVFPLDNQISKIEKYSIFLVHSITLRDDNLPIEGRGVEPDVNIKNPNWQNELIKYFNSPQLFSVLSNLYNFAGSPK